MTETARRLLEEFLVREIVPDSEAAGSRLLSAIQAANLEGAAYLILPEAHPWRTLLRPAFLAATARHGLIRSQLIPLLRAWNVASLEPFIMKGFALANFVYPSPGARAYGDVDIVLPLEKARVAARIAKELGWIEDWNRDATGEYNHEYSHLFTPDCTVRIDLHVEILQGKFAHARREGLTRALVADAEQKTLGGAAVRIPRAVDGLLVLLQNRRFGDSWRRKPSDYLDARFLQRQGVTQADLLARADELACGRSTRLALESCDPWQGRLDLESPPKLKRWSRDALVFHEFGSYAWERLWRVPARFREIWRIWPVLRKAKAQIRRMTDLRELVSAFDLPPDPVRSPDLKTRLALELGVLWGTRLLGPRVNPCVPRSLTLFQTLSQAGFRVSFVSGVRRAAGKLEGHAWVEINGFRSEVLGDLNAPNLYRENFRFDNALERQFRATQPQVPDLELPRQPGETGGRQVTTLGQ